MRDEECSTDLTPIRIVMFTIEDFFIKIDVIYVYSSVECQCYHLRDLIRFDSTGNSRTISRAEAIREDTLCWIAVWSSIGVTLDSCKSKNRLVYDKL